MKIVVCLVEKYSRIVFSIGRVFDAGVEMGIGDLLGVGSYAGDDHK